MSELFFDPVFLLGELGLVALIVILTLADAFRKPLYQLFNGTTQLTELEYRNRQAGWLTGIGLVIVAVLYIFTNQLTGGESAILLHNSLQAGGGLMIGKLVILIAGVLTLLLSIRYTSIQAIPGIDYYLHHLPPLRIERMVVPPLVPPWIRFIWILIVEVPWASLVPVPATIFCGIGVPIKGRRLSGIG